jgi:hypothetical protein
VGLSVDEVIRAVVELGGSYPDVVQALAQASAKDALSSRFRINALPQEGRPYQRSPVASEAAPEDTAEEERPKRGLNVLNPISELFDFRGEKAEKAVPGPDAVEIDPAEIEEIDGILDESA